MRCSLPSTIRARQRRAPRSLRDCSVRRRRRHPYPALTQPPPALTAGGPMDGSCHLKRHPAPSCRRQHECGATSRSQRETRTRQTQNRAIAARDKLADTSPVRNGQPRRRQIRGGRRLLLHGRGDSSGSDDLVAGAATKQPRGWCVKPTLRLGFVPEESPADERTGDCFGWPSRSATVCGSLLVLLRSDNRGPPPVPWSQVVFVVVAVDNRRLSTVFSRACACVRARAKPSGSPAAWSSSYSTGERIPSVL